MKNLFTVVVFTLTTLFTHAQGQSCSETINIGNNPYPQDNVGMPAEIENIIAAGAKTEKIGTLPDGDIIFLVTGITSPEVDTTKWSMSRIFNIGKYYRTRPAECLITKIKRTGDWVVLTYPPTNSCHITEAHLTKDWKIAITLVTESNKKGVVAFYSLDKDDYFFESKEDAEKIVTPAITF